jgi:hypothetical protein
MGQDQSYEVIASKIIQQLRGSENLNPYKGRGIRIKFPISGTNAEFDGVLNTPKDEFVVIECKRWGKGVNQGSLFEFCWKVACLREYLKRPVAAIFVTKTGYDSGAVNVAHYAGVELWTLPEDATIESFTITLWQYDPVTEEVVKTRTLGRTYSAPAQATPSLEMRVIRAPQPADPTGQETLESPDTDGAGQAALSGSLFPDVRLDASAPGGAVVVAVPVGAVAGAGRTGAAIGLATAGILLLVGGGVVFFLHTIGGLARFRSWLAHWWVLSWAG